MRATVQKARHGRQIGKPRPRRPPKSEIGKKILGQLKENLEIAKTEMIPICQDTGMAVIFMEIAALVLGIAGLLFSLFGPFGFIGAILGIVGAILGYLGMKKIDIYGPTTGNTVVYTVCVRDSRAGINITNTFIVIGIPKSDFGVDDNVVNNVSIYPNPSNDGFITIKGEGIAKIFNILGQEIKSIQVNEETKIFLNSGMYIIQMGNLTKKVVVR